MTQLGQVLHRTIRIRSLEGIYNTVVRMGGNVLLPPLGHLHLKSHF